MPRAIISGQQELKKAMNLPYGGSGEYRTEWSMFILAKKAAFKRAGTIPYQFPDP